MARKQKKETFREIYERYKNDPKIMKEMMSGKYEKFGDAMFELSSAIVTPCVDYASDHGDEDEGWAYTIMISLARATCKLLDAMQETSSQAGNDVFRFYTEELLPLCRQISDSENDELMAERERRKNAGKDDIPFETRKAVILAIADPDMTADDIIGKFFSDNLDGKQRKKLAVHIETMRRDYADKLQKLREHTDENGNYKS